MSYNYAELLENSYQKEREVANGPLWTQTSLRSVTWIAASGGATVVAL